ncbi:CFI-box-CTERM domain-containing protein, partial [Arsukibacterium sp.]|uniref:CFI-box-CTERM domain-containing protein n=1 Tax=Arsukibacterium sp. TaxID=1977258 RepID=UPI002FD8C7DE
DEAVSADFTSELQRHFSDILQPLTMQVPQAANEATIRNAYLSHLSRHKHLTEEDTFFSYVTALRVVFPDRTQVAGAVAVKRVSIELGEQKLSTERIVPADQANMLAAWIAQPETLDVFKQWQSTASVNVAFFGQVNDKEQLIGRISLPPDAIANYVDALSQQVYDLWEKAGAQGCIPHSHQQYSDDLDCFFTTASVHCLGLQDDCWELTTLRRFRDNYLLSNEPGKALVAQYYAIAPVIVRHIQQQADARSRWLRVYWGGVLPSAILARLGLHKAAMHWYSRLVRQLST